MEEFDRLYEIMRTLRKKCPWDKEQNHKSLMKYLLEETYEVIDAIEKGDDDNFKEELGDLILQVIFHSVVAEERKGFTLEDVLKSINDKLVRRHPHVFSDTEVSGVEDVLNNWEKIKLNEGKKSALEGVPKTLPALLKSYRIQAKASRVGFDWQDYEDVIKKVDEELRELKTAVESDNKAHIQEEIGDLLFSIVNVSRFLKVDPEEALRKTILKFSERFTFIERELAGQGKTVEEVSLKEMDVIWEQSKKGGTGTFKKNF